MSESASQSRVAQDLVLAEVPAKLWLRSGRPFWGTVTRVYVPFALISGALLFVVPRGAVFWTMVGLGVLAFVLFPVIVQGLLAPLERRVVRADRRDATGLLQEVRQRRLVRLFAPFAWATLQEGRLHLRRGDGKAAVKSFAETQRLARGLESPALASMQAYALLLADQPEQTRELLQTLAKQQALAPIDRLHLGLALQASKGHNREALEHIEAAQQALGQQPRALAGLALALYRVDRVDEAMVALEAARAALGEAPEGFDAGLVERATKLMRTVQKAQQKRTRKQDERGGEVEGVAKVEVGAPAVQDRGPKGKSARKAKKDERRAARRTAKKQEKPLVGAGKGQKGKVPGQGSGQAPGGKNGVKAGAARSAPTAKVEAVVWKPAAKGEAAAVSVRDLDAKVEAVVTKPAAKAEVAAAGMAEGGARVNEVGGKVEAAAGLKAEAAAAVNVMPATAASPDEGSLNASLAQAEAISPVSAKAAAETPVGGRTEISPVSGRTEISPVGGRTEISPVSAKADAAPVGGRTEISPVSGRTEIVPAVKSPLASSVLTEIGSPMTAASDASVKADVSGMRPEIAALRGLVAAPVTPFEKERATTLLFKEEEAAFTLKPIEVEEVAEVEIEAATPARTQVRVSPAVPPARPSTPPVRPAAPVFGGTVVSPGAVPVAGSGPKLPAPPSQTSLFGSLAAKPASAKPMGSGPPPSLLGGPPVLGSSLPPPPRLGPPPAVPPPPRVGPPPPVAAPVIPSAAPTTSEDSWASMLDD